MPVFVCFNFFIIVFKSMCVWHFHSFGCFSFTLFQTCPNRLVFFLSLLHLCHRRHGHCNVCLLVFVEPVVDFDSACNIAVILTLPGTPGAPGGPGRPGRQGLSGLFPALPRHGLPLLLARSGTYRHKWNEINTEIRCVVRHSLALWLSRLLVVLLTICTLTPLEKKNTFGKYQVLFTLHPNIS